MYGVPERTVSHTDSERLRLRPKPRRLPGAAAPVPPAPSPARLAGRGRGDGCPRVWRTACYSRRGGPGRRRHHGLAGGAPPRRSRGRGRGAPRCAARAGPPPPAHQPQARAGREEEGNRRPGAEAPCGWPGRRAALAGGGAGAPPWRPVQPWRWRRRLARLTQGRLRRAGRRVARRRPASRRRRWAPPARGPPRYDEARPRQHPGWAARHRPPGGKAALAPHRPWRTRRAPPGHAPPRPGTARHGPPGGEAEPAAAPRRRRPHPAPPLAPRRRPPRPAPPPRHAQVRRYRGTADGPPRPAPPSRLGPPRRCQRPGAPLSRKGQQARSRSRRILALPAVPPPPPPSGAVLGRWRRRPPSRRRPRPRPPRAHGPRAAPPRPIPVTPPRPISPTTGRHPVSTGNVAAVSDAIQTHIGGWRPRTSRSSMSSSKPCLTASSSPSATASPPSPNRRCRLSPVSARRSGRPPGR